MVTIFAFRSSVVAKTHLSSAVQKDMNDVMLRMIFPLCVPLTANPFHESGANHLSFLVVVHRLQEFVPAMVLIVRSA